MCCYHVNSFGFFFYYYCFGRCAALRLRLRQLHERPERRRPATLEPMRPLYHSERVRQRLITTRPDRHLGVCANRIQQLRNRPRNRPPVPPRVQFAQQIERLRHLLRRIV